MLQNYAPTVLDVRFSAHSTPYKSPILLNGLIAQYRSELERVIGATIVSAGIDMCKFTVCDKGCQTVNHANEVCLLYFSEITNFVIKNSILIDEELKTLFWSYLWLQFTEIKVL